MKSATAPAWTAERVAGGCAICTRHVPDAEGACTGACRHVEAQVGVLCAVCAQRISDGLDLVTAAWQWLADHPGVATGSNAHGGQERALPGGTGRLSYLGHGVESPHGRLTVIAADMHATRLGHPVRVPVATVPMLAAAIRADLWQGDATRTGHILWHSTTIAALATEGRALCGWQDAGSWITCPTETSPGLCGRRLRIDLGEPDAPIRCHWCRREWTALQLLNLAAHADGWADPDAAAEACAVTTGQIGLWVRAGRVRQLHSLVAVADVRTARDLDVAAAHRRLANKLAERRGPGILDPALRCATCGEWAHLEAPDPAALHTAINDWRHRHAALHQA